MKWSREERKQKLIEMSDRSPELNEAAGSEIFQMEFVDYTEDDEYIVKYYIKPWQRNPFHNLQGGMLCYYIDAAAGTLSWISVDCEPVGTVDINVTFIRGVPERSGIYPGKIQDSQRRTPGGGRLGRCLLSAGDLRRGQPF